MLISKLNALENVTVNKGYYTERQKTTTGSMVQVENADIVKTVTTDPIAALESRVPGLFISPYSGLPGTSQTVMLRGKNSIANSGSPLYIVDGMPFIPDNYSVFQYGFSALSGGVSPLSTLNPQDIAEITVLKDADATAIYGSRGANGVILITTKKGKAGRTDVDFDVSSGIGQMPRYAKMLSTPQYLAMRHEAFNNDSQIPGSNDYDINGTWDSTRNVNWQKELLNGTAHYDNFQGRVSGGDESTQFSLSTGYRRQTLVYSRSDQNDKQLNFNASLTHYSSDKRFYVGLMTGYASDKNTLPTADLTSIALGLAPNAPLLVKPGTDSLNWQNNTFTNPLSILKTSASTLTNNLTSNLELRYRILPGLTLHGNTGYNTLTQTDWQLVPGTSFNPDGFIQRSSSYGLSETKTWIAEPRADYETKIFTGKFEALAGATWQQTVRTGTGVQGSGYGNDNQLQNIALAETKYFQTDRYSDYRYSAFYARVNYNWRDKYIVNLTGRRDGSSRFGPGKQFGNFGAAGIGWVFSEEQWMKKASWLSFGKLRASYGSTGNDQIQDYQFLSTYSYQYFTYGGLTGLQPSQLYNPKLAWEVNRKAEAGLELGFLKDRINLTASAYRNRSGNQLTANQLPDITGFSFITANLPATIQNSGLEFLLNTTTIKTKTFVWKSNFNISFPRNKLVSFPDLANSSYAQYLKVGKSLFNRPVYRYLGVDPVLGTYQYQDQNKDGILDSKDYVFDKTIAQKFFGGLENSFSWKGFQFDFFFQFVQQTGISFQSNFALPGTLGNQPETVELRWQNKGDVTSMQKFSQQPYGSDAATAYSNYAIYGSNKIVDASFIRLKNVGFSYALPKPLVTRMHLRNLQVYLVGNNLWTITSYKGLDPATQTRALPVLRVINAGVRVSL